MCGTNTPPIVLEDGTVLSIDQYEEYLEKKRKEDIITE